MPNGKLVASAVVVALVMGLMTSYARAKAESLNAQCTIGIAERAERNILIYVALLLTSLVTDVMSYAFVILAIVSCSEIVIKFIVLQKNRDEIVALQPFDILLANIPKL